MKRLVVGIRQEFLNSFIEGMKELGVKICGEPFEVEGIWHVIYLPIGKEQKEKCEKYIEYRCNNNLM